MTALTLKLPWPPSVNNLFANVPGRGRVRSERYLKWARVAATEIMVQNRNPKRTFGEPVAVAIHLGRPDKRKRDIDGLAKGPLDALVDNHVLADDNLVHSLTLQWADVDGAHITIVPLRQRAAA